MTYSRKQGARLQPRTSRIRYLEPRSGTWSHPALMKAHISGTLPLWTSRRHLLSLRRMDLPLVSLFLNHRRTPSTMEPLCTVNSKQQLSAGSTQPIPLLWNLHLGCFTLVLSQTFPMLAAVLLPLLRITLVLRSTLLHLLDKLTFLPTVLTTLPTDHRTLCCSMNLCLPLLFDLLRLFLLALLVISMTLWNTRNLPLSLRSLRFLLLHRLLAHQTSSRHPLVTTPCAQVHRHRLALLKTPLPSRRRHTLGP